MEPILSMVCVGVIGGLLGFLFGRLHPIKSLLMIEYYRGRIDQIKDNPDYWEHGK
jgi:hypothetical protein